METPEIVTKIQLLLQEHCKDYALVLRVDDHNWHLWSDTFYGAGAAVSLTDSIKREWSMEEEE